MVFRIDFFHKRRERPKSKARGAPKTGAYVKYVRIFGVRNAAIEPRSRL